MQCVKCTNLLKLIDASSNISSEMSVIPMHWYERYLPIKPTLSSQHCDLGANSIVTLNIVI